MAVEGGATIPCRTPFDPPQPLPGEAHVLGTLPPGTLLGDAGNGIGFLVVCLAGTSTNVANLPACDVIVPAISQEPDLSFLNGDHKFKIVSISSMFFVFGLRCAFRPAVDRLFGNMNDNGEWTGLVGDLASGKGDIAASSMDMMLERANFIDYLIPMEKQR